MKRFFAFFICLCLVFSATGCHKDPVPTETGDTVTTASIQQTTNTPETTVATIGSEAVQLPLIAIATPTVTKTETAEDGTLLFTNTYQNISMTLNNPTVADQVILDLLNRIDAVQSTADAILEQARQDFNGSASWNPYFCQILYSPTRIDRGILSLFGAQVSYSGGSHPNQTSISVSYDLVSGKSLSLDDILTKECSMELLCQYLVDTLSDGEAAGQLFSDYAQIVEQRFHGDLSRDEGFYFSTTGLCFYFSPYDIAPYSAGTIVAEISYDKLAGILEDEYFPAEEIAPFGTVETVSFQEADLSLFNQVGEVIVDSQGQTLLLYTSGMVYDLRLETGTASEASFTTPGTTVYAAGSLTPGDAILVQYNWGDDTPALRLTYRTENSIESMVIEP